jgi:hypothetical protein
LLVAWEGPTIRPVPLLVLRADPDEREELLPTGHPFFASRAGRDRVAGSLPSGGRTPSSQPVPVIPSLPDESRSIASLRTRLRVTVPLGERSVQGGVVVEAGDRPVDVVPLGCREAARGHFPRCGRSAQHRGYGGLA